MPIADLTAPAYRKEVVACQSVGFVLADDKYGVVLAASIHGVEAAGVTIIPRSQIKRLKRLVDRTRKR